jgi:GT2 family glycosyltransferase
MTNTIVSCITYNHWDVTKCYLDSIKDIKDTSVKEFIFVDNGSTDGTVQNLKNLGYNVLQTPFNSVAKAINLTIDYDKIANIVIVANDHIIPNGCIDVLNEMSIKYDLGLVSPFTFLSNDNLLNMDSVFNWELFNNYSRQRYHLMGYKESYENYKILYQFVCPQGINQTNKEFIERHRDDPDVSNGWWPGIVFYSRSTLDRIGHYDENYIGAGFEDLDFLSRCHGNGIKTGVTYRTFVFHFGSATTRKFMPTSDHQELCNNEMKNGKYFNEKFSK